VLLAIDFPPTSARVDVLRRVGAEASSLVRVETSTASALAAIVAEHAVTLVVTGWRRAALAADMVLGGQNADLVALADVPVLAVLRAGEDYRRAGAWS
jgi:Universal stress protein family